MEATEYSKYAKIMLFDSFTFDFKCPMRGKDIFSDYIINKTIRDNGLRTLEDLFLAYDSGTLKMTVNQSLRGMIELLRTKYLHLELENGDILNEKTTTKYSIGKPRYLLPNCVCRDDMSIDSTALEKLGFTPNEVLILWGQFAKQENKKDKTLIDIFRDFYANNDERYKKALSLNGKYTEDIRMLINMMRKIEIMIEFYDHREEYISATQDNQSDVEPDSNVEVFCIK